LFESGSLSLMKDKKRYFEAIIESHSKALYTQIRSIVLSHDDADDVLQNTLMKAWQKLDQFKENASIQTWLYRIAINEALMHLRKHKLKTKTPLDENRHSTAYDYSKTETDPEKVLEKALELLTEKQRLVFGLRYYNEMTYKEISEVTDLAEGTIKATYHQVVKKIEQYIDSL